MVWSEAIANANDHEIKGNIIGESSILKSKIAVNIGAAIDLNSRVGKEQKIAMEVAIEDVNRESCYELAMNYSYNIHRNPSSPTMLAAGNFQLLHFSNSISIIHFQLKTNTNNYLKLILMISNTVLEIHID